MLALHGWQRTHQDFSSVFDSCRRTQRPRRRPVRFRGHPAPPEPWGSEQYASHLLALFEEPGLLAERVVLVGHSFGGRVAIPLYGLVPDRIERLVLTGVPLLDRQGRRARPAPAYRLVRRLHAIGVVGDRRMEAMRNRYGSPDYRAAQGVMRGVFVRLLAEQYADGMAAVELSGGPGVGRRGHRGAGRGGRTGPGGRSRPTTVTTLTLLPGVGHLTPTEAPQALRRVILGGSP